MRQVAVRTAWTEAEAQIVVWRLREAGIDASMEGGSLAAAAFDVALTERGGIKVLVPEDQIEKANAELKRMASDADPDGTKQTARDEERRANSAAMRQWLIIVSLAMILVPAVIALILYMTRGPKH